MIPVFILFSCLWIVSCSDAETVQVTQSVDPGDEVVVRLVTSHGDIAVRLDSVKAPAHVTNFIHLCGAGFYNGTYFHRVSPEYLIQGGDPNTRDQDPANDGLGGHTYAGPRTALRLESGTTSLVRGDVAMALTDEVNSAGSQFFILLANSADLESPCTVFGKVVEGIEVADQISEVPGTPDVELGGFNPATPQYIEECIVEQGVADSTEFEPTDSEGM